MTLAYKEQNFLGLVTLATQNTSFRAKFLAYINDVIKEYSALRAWAVTRTSLTIRSGREEILAKVDIILRDLLECEAVVPSYRQSIQTESGYWKRFRGLVQSGLVDEIKSAPDSLLKPCYTACLSNRSVLMQAVRERYQSALGA